MKDSKDANIVNQAIINLENVAAIHADWEFIKNKEKKELDGVLTIAFSENSIKFKTDIKKEVRHTQLEQIRTQASENDNFLLLAQNIFPKAKEMLRKEKIAYLDVAGNFYFHNESHYIFIEGNKIPALEKEKPNRAFTPTGLKIIFLFLTEKDAINMSYREIAQRTNVALGNIPLVINGLQEAGYLISKNRSKHILTRKKQLLNRWVTGYGETLRPKLELGKYRFLEKNKSWEEYQLAPGDVWGGETGANLITNYIEPEIKTLYTKLSKIELIKKMKLVPESNGDIEILQHFWQDADDLNLNHAPPILIYADLILSQDPRNAEVAELIFDNYLKSEF